MRRRAIQIARNVAAVILLLLGVVGLFLPLLQGVALIVAAFFVADFRRKHVWRRWLLSRRWARRLGSDKLQRKLDERYRRTHPSGPPRTACDPQR